MEEQLQSSAPKKEYKNRKSFLIGFAIFLIIAILGSAGIGIYRVYAQNATDNFSVAIARVLHLPIVSVEGKKVLYSDYAKDLKAIQKILAYAKANGDTEAPNLTPEQMSDEVLIRLVGNVFIKETAEKYGVKVEDSDRENLKVQIIQQFSSLENAETELQKRYGWDLKTYEDRVMIPFILQSKASKKLAEDVLGQIKNGANFEEMAKKYGEDGTSANGGDLGWFAKGKMVPEFEEAAFKLNKGELAPELVQTEFGYHIIKVEDKKTEKIKNDKGKMVDEEQVKARHILFMAPGLQRFVEEKMQQANIKMHTKVHNPFLTLKKTS